MKLKYVKNTFARRVLIILLSPLILGLAVYEGSVIDAIKDDWEELCKFLKKSWN